MNKLKWVERDFVSAEHPGETRKGHVAMCSCGCLTFIVSHIPPSIHMHLFCPSCEESYCDEGEHHKANGPKPQA
jgi:hypothetical protein